VIRKLEHFPQKQYSRKKKAEKGLGRSTLFGMTAQRREAKPCVGRGAEKKAGDWIVTGANCKTNKVSEAPFSPHFFCGDGKRISGGHETVHQCIQCNVG
jgi:hypothetical protein